MILFAHQVFDSLPKRLEQDEWDACSSHEDFERRYYCQLMDLMQLLAVLHLAETQNAGDIY